MKSLKKRLNNTANPAMLSVFKAFNKLRYECMVYLLKLF